MPIATTRDLIQRARDGGYAVPAFNVIGLEHAEAIVRAAESVSAPVILQISQNAVRYHGGAIEPIGRACAELAGAARVLVSLHLDHATSLDLCQRAAACGFSSAMLDAAELPFDENVRQTRELVAWAHAHDVAVEAALGVVGGKDGVTTTSEGLTDPETARRYVAETGVDALAVAIGTSHAMRERTARLDLALLGRIRAAVAIPLVLHGSSGAADADLQAAARAGAAKINLATQLNIVFTGAVRRCLDENAGVVDPRRYLAEGRRAIQELAADQLSLLGTAGRA